jgi:hypothetical protein
LYEASLLSERIRTFRKGVKCVSCGLEAQYCALEQDLKAYRTYKGYSKYHINLYAQDRTGKETLFTSDHIVPKALGGCNCEINRQPMCSVCNTKKAHLLPGIIEELDFTERKCTKGTSLKYADKETAI